MMDGQRLPADGWSAASRITVVVLTLSVGILCAQTALADPITDHYPGAANSGCMTCHAGIELIREPGSEMLDQIMQRGTKLGDPAGCIVCHAGDPKATEKGAAHTDGHFFPDPGSPWINDQTCGQCHPTQVRTQWTSLMMTEAGKIQGVCWAFGSMTGYEHLWANYAVRNPDNPLERLGTPDYLQYMERLKKREPNVFVDRHEPLPDAPLDISKLNEDPTLAAFTYIRQECQRCHHAVKGREKRGDFRGMGCSSCHIPYGNEGRYEGGDPTIDRTKPSHGLVHSIQGTREAKVTVHDVTYSGIPVETCTTCHDRGKRIGVSFQGLMETPYESPFAKDGSGQPALHSKHYIAMEQDIHYQKGMLCQDCHTSLDVHSDGFLAAANLAAVQIECADCHGTPNRFPWELPLGFMDEFEERPASGPPRGTAKETLEHTRQGTVYDARDGYLRTARGNPYGNVVRDGNDVIVHTASGKDIRMKPLKAINDSGKLSLDGQVAMGRIGQHLERMECYTCHSTWSPQCFGCHVKIDYTRRDDCPECENFDWVAAGRRHADPKHAADRGEKGYDTIIPGKITEQRSYLRWEEPMLGINGEGRVSPLAPGCQPSVTIIGEDGKPILLNHIFRTEAGSEGSGEHGQLALDMSPTQPHTTTKTARSCESCHSSDKALGYGIGGGKYTRPLDKDIYVDIETVDGTVLSKNAVPQFEKIDGLTADWSRIVTEDGEQLMTVGHHFQLSRPLNDEERTRMSRHGTCLACHQDIPDESLAVSLLHHIAEYSDQIPESASDHNRLLRKITLSSAWAQATAGFLLGIAALWTTRRLRRRWGNLAPESSESPADEPPVKARD